MSHGTKRSGVIFACLVVAACGGGGGDGVTPSGDRPAGDPSFEVGTQKVAGLILIGFEGDGTPRSSEGTVDLASGLVTGGVLEGRLNASRTRIDLDGGGTVELSNPAATEYVRLFSATPGTGAPFFGVVGFPSTPGDLPGSGRISFTGATVLTASDATRRYDLSGEAYIVADFGSGRVNIALRDLGGTAQGIGSGNPGPATIPGTGEIVIEDSRISGARFAGGSASTSGLPFSLTSQADASGTRGAFFGPEADEVAGRVDIDDPTGDVRVLGAFVAE